MDNFVLALKGALEFCKVCKEFQVVAKEIASGIEETMTKLAEEAAGVARQEANNFREALRTAKSSGDALMQRYDALKTELDKLASYTEKFPRNKTVSRDDVTEESKLLRSVLLRAKNYIENYPAFQEKFQKAIDLGTLLVEKCRVSGQKADVRASDIRIGGYVASGALGAGAAGIVCTVAAGFLTFATGGIGAVFLGIGAAGVGAYARNRAKQMKTLAGQFQALQVKLQEGVDRLNRDADSIENNQAMTRVMVEELEMRLKLAKQEPVAVAATN